jgi:hypothetical protein
MYQHCGEEFTDSVLELVSGAAQRWTDTINTDSGESDQFTRSGENPKGSELEVIITPSDHQGLASDQRREDGTELDLYPGPPTRPQEQAHTRGSKNRKVVNPDWDESDVRGGPFVLALQEHSRQRRSFQSAEWVLLCINQPRKKVNLVHYDMRGRLTDEAVFTGMKALYKSERSWRFLLSEISHVEWRKVNEQPHTFPLA